MCRNMSCKCARTRIRKAPEKGPKNGVPFSVSYLRLLKQLVKNNNVFVVFLAFFKRETFVRKQSTCLSEHNIFENQYFNKYHIPL